MPMMRRAALIATMARLIRPPMFPLSRGGACGGTVKTRIRRNQFGNGFAAPGDGNLFAVGHAIKQRPKAVFGFVSTDFTHDRLLYELAYRLAYSCNSVKNEDRTAFAVLSFLLLPHTFLWGCMASVPTGGDFASGWVGGWPVVAMHQAA